MPTSTDKLIRELISLSDGTIAGLCGSTRYDACDAFTVAWVTFEQTTPSGSEHWQQSYYAFMAQQAARELVR
jgi:hypothetical protein